MTKSPGAERRTAHKIAFSRSVSPRALNWLANFNIVSTISSFNIFLITGVEYISPDFKNIMLSWLLKYSALESYEENNTSISLPRWKLTEYIIRNTEVLTRWTNKTEL